MAAPDDGEEWQFSLEDLEDGEQAGNSTEDRGAAEAEGEGEGEGEADADGNVAGTLRPDRPVMPGNIDPENAFFVLVGALIAGLFVGAVLSLAL